LETHGPLGTIWVGLVLSAFYVGLIWINSLLGIFLTPLFIIPITWFIGGKKPAPPSSEAAKQSPLLIEEIAADASRPRNDRM